MNGHAQFEHDLDLYVLGVLSAEEKRAFEQHLKDCPECAGQLKHARQAVALIGLAEPITPPPAGAKERLMARIKPHEMPVPAAPAPNYWRWATLAFAAATIVLLFFALSFVQQNRSLNQQFVSLTAEVARQQHEVERARAVLQVLTAPATLQVTLTAANAHPLPQGHAFYNPNKGLLFYASNLAPSAKGRTYQLWLVPQKGKPVSAGIFKPDSHGNASVILPPLPKGMKAAAFAVTVEPAGGVPQPTGPKVLIGAVS